MKLVWINGCVRGEASRTQRLTEALLKRLRQAEPGCEVQEVCLAREGLRPMDGAMLAQRDALAQSGRFHHPLFARAREFAAADTLVVSAPYWDLSFPAAVKTYVEHVSVCGLAFCYGETGEPVGLCRANTLYYVTTAGGYIGERDFGYAYIKGLAETFYGISNIRRVAAEGLDIAGADVEQILAQAEAGIVL